MSFSQSLCAINEGHNDLHVFAIGSANTLNFIHGNSAANQWTAICPGWNGSAPLQSLCAVTDRKDALYVFGIGIDNTLYLTLGNVQSTWSEWSSNWNSAPEMSNLKSTPKLKSISVVTDSVINVLRVFGVDITNTLYFSQTSTQGNWIGWTRLGSCPKLTSVVAVHDSKNVLHVFGIGPDNTTYMTINNGYSWTPNWNDAPKLRSVFALNIDKFLHVFGIGTDNTFYTTYRNLQGIWSEWYANWNLAPKLKAVLAVNDCNNALHVFGIGIDNTLYLTWRNLQGTWSEWYPNWNRAPKLTSVFAVNDSKNALHVFGIDQTNNLCLTWRSPDGNWSAWTKEAMMPWPFTREQHPILDENVTRLESYFRHKYTRISRRSSYKLSHTHAILLSARDYIGAIERGNKITGYSALY